MSGSHQILIKLLFELNQSMAWCLKKFTRREQLPMIYFAVMMEIVREPGITVSRLARSIGISKSRVSTIVEELHKKGHVQKRPDCNDKRLICLYSAPKDSDLWDKRREKIQQHLAGLVADFPLDETEQMIRLLGRLKGLVEKNKARLTGQD